MKTSFFYHAALSLISRQAILKSKREVSRVEDSLGFLEYYHGLSQEVVVLGSKDALMNYPSDVFKKGRKTILANPSGEFWLSEDRGSFTRGDICFHSNVPPLFDGFLRSYECRVIWNYSSIVNASIEKWSRENAEDPGRSSVVQHVNRIAGADYFILKSSLHGMSGFFRYIKNGMDFHSWVHDIDPVEAAVNDAKKYWGKRWFMEEHIWKQSIKEIEAWTI